MNDTTWHTMATASDAEPDATDIIDDYRRSLDVMDAAIASADPAGGTLSHRATNGPLVRSPVTPSRSSATSCRSPATVQRRTSTPPSTCRGGRIRPTSAWAATRRLVETELLDRPDRLAAVRITPLGVETPMAMLLRFQGMDPVVHGWDVATATGGSVDIPADLADKYVERFTPVADQVRAAGLLGAARHGGRTSVDRLLDFCGRVRECARRVSRHHGSDATRNATGRRDGHSAARRAAPVVARAALGARRRRRPHPHRPADEVAEPAPGSSRRVPSRRVLMTRPRRRRRRRSRVVTGVVVARRRYRHAARRPVPRPRRRASRLGRLLRGDGA